MLLKSLELQGFKSFPDKTQLKFDNGITIVVGPNGSGKSNISDAMKWVLGEISTRSIRGSKMEDVIFSGTDSRRPMGFAEVSLTIDNTDKNNLLPIEYSEVTVTRRYYRSGESEYYINKKPVRLKDIHELFYNTGIGRDGYSIISQGKVAEIISQKSEERRNVFEEAAGISKYRHKKQEAERKLASCEDNLTRVNDILNELAGRVEPLEKEAAKAKKYLELFEEKKKADIAVWLYDSSIVRSQINELDELIALSQNDLNNADDNISSLEQQSDRLLGLTQENTSLAEETSSKIAELTETKLNLEGSVKVFENDILHNNDQIQKLNADKMQKSLQLEKSDEKYRELQGQLEHIKALEKENTASLNEVSQKYEDEKNELVILETVLEEKDDFINQINNNVYEAKIRLSSLEGSFVSDSERKVSVEAEFEKTRLSMESEQKNVEKFANSVAQYERDISSVKSDISKTNDTLSEIAEKKEDLISKRSEIVSKYDSKIHRAEILERMEEQLEGYSGSVKFVMNEQANNRLSGIIGPISKLITVPAEYALAIEVALGGNIQNIVVEDESAAKKAINALKKEGAGRATFYPITTVRAQEPNVDIKKLSSCSGYLGIADELVENAPIYDEIVKSLIGKVFVFDTLDNASNAAKIISYKARLVTLDGQQINAGGSYSGGSHRRDVGFLTRTVEIERIRTEADELSKSKEVLDLQVESLSKEQTVLLNKKSDYENKLSLLNTMCQAENTNMLLSKSRLERETEQAKVLNEELERIASHGTQFVKEIDNQKTVLRELEEECALAEKDRERALSVYNDKVSVIEKIRSEKEVLFTRGIEYKKDIELCDSLTMQAYENRALLSDQIRKCELSVKILEEKISSAHSDIEKTSNQINDLALEIESFIKMRVQFIDKNSEFEQKIADIRVQIKEKTVQKEALFKEFTRLDSKRSQILTNSETITSKLWEEYELTFNSAIESGYVSADSETRSSFAKIQSECKNKLRALGSVNVSAIEEYKEVKERFDFLSVQCEDLTKSKASLASVIYKLEHEMKDRFSSAMEEINKQFKIVFKELFGGGSAELILTDPENVLTSGIEINVAPPGKIIKNLSLLSGGEQSFIAIALLFAILNVNPTPFCVFDEIESALDEVNVSRLADYFKKYANKTQFIVITHRRGTMESADVLYGVTMREKGVSKVFTLNVNEIEEKIGVQK